MPNLRPNQLSKDTAADILAEGKDTSYLLLSRDGVAIDTAISVEEFEEAIGISSTKYNVKAFGAVGDGVTDDTAAFTSCIAAAADGSTVEIPVGVYNLAPTWTEEVLTKSLLFRGEIGTRIIGPTADAAASRFVRCAVGKSLAFDRIEFTNFYAAAYLLDAGSSSFPYVAIRNCVFDGVRYPIYDSGTTHHVETAIIENNIVKDATRSPYRGFVLRPLTFGHITVVGNQISGCSTTDQVAAIWVGDNHTTSGHATIQRNVINGVVTTGATADAHGVFCYAESCDISSNQITDVQNGNMADNCEGIYVKSAAPMISGNLLVDAGCEAYIQAKGGTGTLDRGGLISGNVCRRVSNAMSFMSGFGGWGIATTGTIDIIGNDIDGTYGGIMLRNVDSSNVCNNRIVGIGSTGIECRGIYLYNATNCTVSSNVISGQNAGGAATYCILAGSALESGNDFSNVSISGNVLGNMGGSSSDRMALGFQLASGTTMDNLTFSDNVIDTVRNVTGLVGTANITPTNVAFKNNSAVGITADIVESTLDSIRANWVFSGNTGSGSGAGWPDVATQTATGTFTINTSYPSTSIDSSGGAVTATLGSGDYIGQTHTVVMTNATAASTLAVTNHDTIDGRVFNFAAVDETVVLQWTGTEWTTLRDTTRPDVISVNVGDFGLISSVSDPGTTSRDVNDAAVAAARSVGGHLYFPAGTFWFNDTVVLQPDELWQGAGPRATTLKYRYASGTDAIAMGKFCGLEHLRIDCGNQVLNGVAIDLAKGYDSGDESSVQRCWLRDVAIVGANKGVTLSDTATVTIDHCFITSNNYGVVFEDCAYINDVTIKNCEVSADVYGLQVNQCRNCQLIDSTIQNCGTAGIFGGPYSASNSITQLIVERCYFEANGSDDILLDAVNSGCVIRSNNFNQTTDSIETTTYATNGLFVDNNTYIFTSVPSQVRVKFGSGAVNCKYRRGRNVTDSNNKENFTDATTSGVTLLEDNYIQQATGTYTIKQNYQSTAIDSSGGAVTATLGAGSYIGQTHTVVMTNATASSTLSVTNHETSDPEVFTFDAVDEVAVLLWTGTEWITLYATATV